MVASGKGALKRRESAPLYCTRSRQVRKRRAEVLADGDDLAAGRPQIPEDLQGEYGTLTPDIKRKILGLNAAKLYDIEVPSEVPQEEAVMAGSEPDYPERPL